MHTQSGGHRGEHDRRLERAIVLVLLSEDDGKRQWSHAELGEGMDVAQDELTLALGGLLKAGVLEGERDRVWPSPATRQLDRLELVGV